VSCKSNSVATNYNELVVTRVKDYKQEVLGRTNSLLSLTRQGPYRKRRVQQFNCYVRIRCRGNVFTEPLPSNDRAMFTEPLPSNDRRDTYTDTQTDGRD
jgi:hypothetical protein